jgi:hypothetical protein
MTSRTFQAYGVPCAKCWRPLAVWHFVNGQLVGLHARSMTGGDGSVEFYDCERYQVVTVEPG